MVPVATVLLSVSILCVAGVPAPSAPWLPGQENMTKAHPDDVCVSPDGTRLALVAGIGDPQGKKDPATLVWTSGTDGSAMKQVTPWTDDVVPLLSSPD